MSSLVILFVATIAVIVPLNVESASSANLDVNKILDLVRQQQRSSIFNKQRRQPLRQDSSDSDSDSDSSDDFSDLDSDDSDSNRYARFRNDKLIDLLENVANDKKIRVINTDRNVYRKEKPNYAQNNFAIQNEKYDDSQRSNNLQTQILEKLLSEGINEEDRKRKPRTDLSKKRLKPNRLTSNINYNNKKESKDYNRHAEPTGLEDYSKVYIVLNPQAVRKSKNKNSLNELVSKVLALSSPKKENQPKRKPLRYKGFLVKDDHLSRRSRRDSKEMFAPRDEEDDYKQKRSRNREGGGAGGRTAIPYIRHRGDIYERDN